MGEEVVVVYVENLDRKLSNFGVYIKIGRSTRHEALRNAVDFLLFYLIYILHEIKLPRKN
jgi:hypothetical protein